LCDTSDPARVKEGNAGKGDDMTEASIRDELVARLVRAGELEISGESQEEVGSYFDTENFAFHGPGGFDSDYAGLTEYFQSRPRSPAHPWGSWSRTEHGSSGTS
jgi:hypothetical protein